MDYGNSTACHQSSDDTNTIIEGTAIKRVVAAGSGPGVDYVTLGGAWLSEVCTGEDGEKFYGLAATQPDLADDFATWHEGIRTALPDLDEEGNPVTITKDDPLTNIGVNTPGTLLVWDATVNTADELVGYCERPVEVDNATITVRMGIK